MVVVRAASAVPDAELLARPASNGVRSAREKSGIFEPNAVSPEADTNDRADRIKPEAGATSARNFGAPVWCRRSKWRS